MAHWQAIVAEGPLRYVQAIEAARDVHRAMDARLSPRYRRVLALYYGLDGDPPMTLAQVGEHLRVSTPRAGQIRIKALRQLRGIRELRLEYDPRYSPPKPPTEPPLSRRFFYDYDEDDEAFDPEAPYHPR